jgi:hypothetical protein
VVRIRFRCTQSKLRKSLFGVHHLCNKPRHHFVYTSAEASRPCWRLQVLQYQYLQLHYFGAYEVFVPHGYWLKEDLSEYGRVHSVYM